MRDYAKVEPKMWHGKTCKDLRKKGAKALLVGLYLMTSPSSNMLGLFNQPILYMAHETGLGVEGAMEGLTGCIEAGFCSYDEESETVFVHEMAKYQIAPFLKATDLRCKGVQKDYDALHDNPFLGAFFDRYGADFHMTSRRGIGEIKQAPTKPLQSQEQEQEQEQENICLDLLPESGPELLTEFVIPLNDSTEYRVPYRELAEWEKAYLAVNVRQELREIRTWSLANKAKRKTKTGVSRFIVAWLAKAQDNPPHSRQFTSSGGGTGAAWEGAK